MLANMVKRILLSVLLVLLAVIGTIAQELRCNVTVSARSIQGANQNLFKTMQSDLYEFMNNRKWTDHVYTYDEKIKCNILIRLDEQLSADEFKGSIQVQLTRPVYNSSYTSTILNIKDDDFHCNYVQYQSLDFNETSNRDNLTNIMAFYAYVILGFDYDTFSLEGGTPYFQKAQAIVSNSQSASEKGWKSYESDQNRYWLVENVLNKSYSSFRSAMYTYHRLGLDVMADRAEEGRAVIAEALRDIQKVFRRRSSTYILQMFFDAKADELVNIFSKSFPDERTRVLTILNEVDPSNGSTYDEIEESDDF